MQCGEQGFVKTVKMLPRHTHETTVSMVPTPRSYDTAPHGPVYRAQIESNRAG
jgi:hypothetical protein